MVLNPWGAVTAHSPYSATAATAVSDTESDRYAADVGGGA